MAVTVTNYAHTYKLLLNKEVNFANLKVVLLNNAGAAPTFDRTHTSKEQVDNGSKSVVTMTQATPAIITHAAHGKSAGTPVTLITTGALYTGFAAGTTYFIVNP